jgi:methionyl-tRNA formyltransferase
MQGSRRIKISKAALTDQKSKAAAGTIDLSDDRMLVSTSSFDLELIEVQPEGKRRMTASEFVRGYRPKTGDVLT